MRRIDDEFRGGSDELRGAWRKLEKYGEVRQPRDAEEPVLAPSVRAAVYEWLTEINASAELAAVGIKPRRTALLFGPPGCGKTTLAHHLAARLGIPLVAIEAEQLVGSHLGATGRNVADLFDTLKTVAGKCVVLLDEIDSIGSKRSTDDQACAREMNAALNTLLRQIESFEGIALAATNREDQLDPALWRRFGLQISVELPGGDERFAIIRRCAVPFELSDADIDLLVDMTIGASPALLRGLVEGVKRSLVLGERIRRPTGDPAAVFAAVIAAVRPHPDYDAPPLWAGGDSEILKLRGLSWPPARAKEAA